MRTVLENNLARAIFIEIARDCALRADKTMVQTDVLQKIVGKCFSVAIDELKERNFLVYDSRNMNYKISDNPAILQFLMNQQEEIA